MTRRALPCTLGLASLLGLVSCQLFATVKEPAGAAVDAGADATSNACSGAGCGVDATVDATTDAGADGRADGSADATPDAHVDPCIGTVCATGSVCVNGLCCIPAATDGGTTGPIPWMVSWTLAGSASAIEAELSIENDDPGDAINMSIGALIGSIDGMSFDLGLSTNNSDAVSTAGRSIRFTRFFSGDMSEIRAAETSTLEPYPEFDDRTGLQRVYNWRRGQYKLRIVRGAPEVRRQPGVPGDWFDASVVHVRADVTTPLGSIWFPRAQPTVPATISPSISQYPLFHQLFAQGGSTFYARYADVPTWLISTRVSSSGGPAATAQSTYYPEASGGFRNSDVWFAADAGQVVTVFGGQTPRCHPSGALF